MSQYVQDLLLGGGLMTWPQDASGLLLASEKTWKNWKHMNMTSSKPAIP